MKIKDVVFYIEDDEIIKTRIVGTKEVLEDDSIVKFYAVMVDKRGNREYVVEEDLHESADSAKKEMQERAIKEVSEKMSKIVMTDLIGN